MEERTLSTELTVTISAKEIMEMLNNHGKKLEAIYKQTKMTNGRVTELEQKSLGVWISVHPFKFTGLMAVLLTLLLTPFLSESGVTIIQGFLRVFGV